MARRKKIIFFTGAGISQESGIDTFRDSGGIWEQHTIEQVATATAMYENTETVLEFFNDRRLALGNTLPNKAHELIAKLEEDFDVEVITQNVDDLHERAGSSNVTHLHGELTKVCSMKNHKISHDIGYNTIRMGELASDGEQLRPDVVLFGEDVPKLEVAQTKMWDADIIVVVGTSLSVYPAANLVGYGKNSAKYYFINPEKTGETLMYSYPHLSKAKFILKKATAGMEELYSKLVDKE